ncbi:MAG: L-histidine N(alpha)-methyltransferase, partial [Myxococcales bacterium]|nr:L-histidine N(alpha)-methyltransferase [Myxococcales bacterium]
MKHATAPAPETSTPEPVGTPRAVETRASSRPVTLLDLEPRTDTFLEEALAGLRRPSGQRTLPCKFFYDRRGSRLFDKICELPEYYPTRTELGIMREHAPAMGRACGRDAMIVEFGSGSSLKTRLLLEHLPRPSACVPVDISRAHLLEAAETLADAFPAIEILPV